jgi:UDP-N-acetylglucosamine--N-acetylmuramyl-(pentapeptide) pyrophosphoryl-undecaprenol N-acetylglucosamine transferase
VKNKKLKILISGGGTGGHIFPAIAIANKLKNKFKNAEILFVGAKGRMEMEKVPAAGYPIKGLWISGFQRSLSAENISFPFKLISSLYKAGNIIKKFKPDVAVGTGGYASGPLLYKASKSKIPTLILEQNSYPGITNKILGKTVDIVCVAYQGMEKYFPPEKIVLTGSPIREEILYSKIKRPEALDYFELSSELPVLLIIGGSQGARGINNAILNNLASIIDKGIQIIWQTGKSSFQEAKQKIEENALTSIVKVKEFISRMDMAYAAADVIVSRAGAIAIAEIIAVGKPAVFIPLPSAAEDHQTKNAKALTEKGAGLLLKESEANNKIADMVTDLILSDERKRKIKENLKKFKTSDATEKIIEQIIKLLNKNG